MRWTPIGVPSSKKLTRRTTFENICWIRGQATSIYCAQFSLGIPIVRHCWHVFPPSTMIDNRLHWCKFACTRAAYINDNGAYRERIAHFHSHTLGSDIHGRAHTGIAISRDVHDLAATNDTVTLSSRRWQANRSLIPDMFARVIKSNYNYS